MNLILHPSKYCKDRKYNPDAIIVHFNSNQYTNPKDVYDIEGVCNTLDTLGLSYNYLIGRDVDAVYLLVPPEKIAYHAGYGSLWGNPVNPNNYSIGICFLAKYGDTYLDHQLNNFVDLVKQLRVKYRIPLNRIVGHEHVDPTRKKDPGPSFPWEILDKCVKTI